MLKRTLKIVLAVIVCLFTMTACSGYVSYYDKIDTVIIMSEDMVELYSNGSISVGENINKENISEHCPQEYELYKLLNSNNEYNEYSFAMIAKDKVLVRTDVIFNSVEGYVVNFGTDIPEEILTVPEQLNYDGNIITLSDVDKYPNVYTFRAGL